MTNAFKLSVDENQIARLTFDLPNEKVNKFSEPVLMELEQIIDSIANRTDIRALIFLSGKEDIFIAGADLHSFEPMFKDPSLTGKLIHAGHRVFNKIESLPFPTIAFIHGACLGGGMEMALSCTYRVITDSLKTLLGLPEVSLGIIPGWGGTQRMPRLVGLMEGLNLILTAKPVKPPKAFKIHLADALVANEFKEESLNAFVDLILTPAGKKKVLEARKKRGWMDWLLTSNPLGRAFLYHKARKDVLSKTKGHYPAPIIALDLIEKTYTMPQKEGLKIEAATIIDSLPKGLSTSEHLIHLFFVNEALKKDKGVASEVTVKPIKSTAVLGAGVMGSGIAWLLANADYPVRMRDIDLPSIGKGYGTVKGLFDQYVKDKRLKPAEASLKFQKLTGTVDLDGLSNVDLVIEAAIENLELKRKLFQELEEKVSPTTIIASNTSSLSIDEMAKSFKHPERFIGMHFFNPVPKMPLVEIVPGSKTSPETIATAVEFCKKPKKTPMVVGDCAGFVVNRVFAIGANEIMMMFEEGVPHEKLSKMMLNYGYPMEPFTLADEVGIDVMYKVNKILEAAYGDRMKGSKVFDTLYNDKAFGKKVGKGFYIYNGKKKEFNKDALKQVNGKASLPEVEMVDRVMLSMINEAARCLDEKVVASRNISIWR
jgi:3-hydroxyacyl-CoA dehydrogenase/enoyl-CoA hydratase/3-hydroxybutyryl-CoA epimerase